MKNQGLSGRGLKKKSLSILYQSFTTKQNFLLVEFESICREHNKFDSNIDFLGKDRLRILVLTKMKAFADNKLNIAKMMISVCERVEKIVGRGENKGFLLFPQCFPGR